MRWTDRADTPANRATSVFGCPALSKHSQHPPPSALLVFRVGTEGDYYFFPRVLGLTEFPELGMPEFSEPAPRLSNYVLSLLAGVLLMPLLARPVVAAESGDDDHPARVVGGYFEEWSIYLAKFNIANLHANGVADKLTHLTYAFGNATPSGCAIADSYADYQAVVPGVGGASPNTGPLQGNFGALQQLKQLHPNLKVLISLAGAAGFSSAASTAAGREAFLWRTASTCSSTGISAGEFLLPVFSTALI